MARLYRENLEKSHRIEFAGPMKRKMREALISSRDFASERAIVDYWFSKLITSCLFAFVFRYEG